MNQRQTERVATSVATLTCVVDTAVSIAQSLLGDALTSSVDGTCLDQDGLHHAVAARVGIHLNHQPVEDAQ